MRAVPLPRKSRVITFGSFWLTHRRIQMEPSIDSTCRAVTSRDIWKRGDYQ